MRICKECFSHLGIQADLLIDGILCAPMLEHDACTVCGGTAWLEVALTLEECAVVGV